MAFSFANMATRMAIESVKALGKLSKRLRKPTACSRGWDFVISFQNAEGPALMNKWRTRVVEKLEWLINVSFDLTRLHAITPVSVNASVPFHPSITRNLEQDARPLSEVKRMTPKECFNGNCLILRLLT